MSDLESFRNLTKKEFRKTVKAGGEVKNAIFLGFDSQRTTECVQEEDANQLFNNIPEHLNGFDPDWYVLCVEIQYHLPKGKKERVGLWITATKKGWPSNKELAEIHGELPDRNLGPFKPYEIEGVTIPENWGLKRRRSR